ncbi:9628_t:CDS:10 [Paraglomus occultum]|uniref:9628_t:CDS:1 n=1 Tax=Paraglomus occultum TaxID=144539 RepID=A0A9N9C674_9GLOM|nr:9628_t:CDS:10 [Paraglomus occultum]
MTYEDDIRLAIELSLKERSLSDKQQSLESVDNQKAIAQSSSADTRNDANILGSLPDRKQLERERLARIEKRKNESSECGSNEKRRITDTGAIGRNDVASGPVYLNGITKLIHVSGFDGDYFRFEDLIHKAGLKKGFFSTYVFDSDWFLSHIPNDANIVLAMHWSPDNGEKQGVFPLSTSKYKLTIVHPPMPPSGFGCFHPKLMLLFYENWMRVVISSANLVPYDWDTMENIAFVQDFPVSGNTVSSIDELPSFARDLCSFLTAMKVPAQVCDKLKEYDFTSAQAILVPSVAGTHRSSKLKLYGHTRLAEAVRTLCGTLDDVQLECQTSSLGSLHQRFLEEFYRSASGLDPVDRSVGKKKETSVTPKIAVGFPSLKTVQQSRHGPAGAGTIFLSRKHYEKSTFPKHVLRDSVSRRRGTLMHLKLILAYTNQQPESPNYNSQSTDASSAKSRVTGWYYCGSHNFTMAAWGQLTTSRQNKQLQLTIKNWELGVILPIKEDDNIDDNNDRLLSSGLPIPFERPLRKYSTTDEPWVPDPPKHFVNDSNEIVVEALRGLCLTRPSLRFIEREKVVYRTDIDIIRTKQVTLISGGGAGHEPAHAGFVGANLLSAAVSGNVFASPSASQILAAIRRVQSPYGTLLIVKNYTGDCLNFGLAAERAKAEGIKVDMIIVGDDVGVGRKNDGLVGRRGLAGTVLVHKVAGAVAANGATLEQVKAAARTVIENLGTVGVAFDRCTIPGSDNKSLLPANQIELGLGIHGEPGSSRISLLPSRELVRQMLEMIISKTDPDRSYLDIQENRDSVVLLVNNLGATSGLECSVVLNDALLYLNERGLEVKRSFVGSFMTSLNMPGISLTILKLPQDEDLIKHIDKPVDAPGWMNYVTVDTSQLDEELDEKVSDSTHVPTYQYKVIVDPSLFERTVRSACESAIKNEPEITAADTIAGDGDCGITIANGAKAVLGAFEKNEIDSSDCSRALLQISNILENTMGGTSGALYCIFLNALARELRNAVETRKNAGHTVADAQCWVESLKKALSDLESYTPAREGDRTLMDALIPFVTSFSHAISVDSNMIMALTKAAEMASQGAQNTRNMRARLGRASYLDDESLITAGIIDAGALAVTKIVDEIVKVLTA